MTKRGVLPLLDTVMLFSVMALNGVLLAAMGTAVVGLTRRPRQTVRG